MAVMHCHLGSRHKQGLCGLAAGLGCVMSTFWREWVRDSGIWEAGIHELGLPINVQHCLWVFKSWTWNEIAPYPDNPRSIGRYCRELAGRFWEPLSHPAKEADLKPCLSLFLLFFGNFFYGWQCRDQKKWAERERGRESEREREIEWESWETTTGKGPLPHVTEGCPNHNRHLNP